MVSLVIAWIVRTQVQSPIKALKFNTLWYLVLDDSLAHWRGKYCTVFLVYLQVVLVNPVKILHIRWRSSASLPPEPVNCAVQHIKGFRQESVLVENSHSHSGFHVVQFFVILMCHLLTYANKTATGLYQIKGVLVIFWTALTDQSEPLFPIHEY